MTDIKTIQQESPDVYEGLLKCECKVSYNGKVLYEGKYNPEYEYTEDINKNCVVIDFNVNEQHFITLEEANNNIEILTECVDEFNDIFKDAKLYNKLMHMANHLPLYNICEDEDINKRGDNFKKLYENYYLWKTQKNLETK